MPLERKNLGKKSSYRQYGVIIVTICINFATLFLALNSDNLLPYTERAFGLSFISTCGRE